MSNAVARACSAWSDGEGWPAEAVVTIHAVMLAVGAAELLLLAAAPLDEVDALLELLELPLLHAAAPVATAAATATAASARLLLRIVVSCWG